ncbi:MAG: glycosyltransferase family 2 protein [Candidatus Bathyarchaeota archaeon]|nr:glycosyltransferase family 2 protein [Candidatus Bathyarchaeota archaeon]
MQVDVVLLTKNSQHLLRKCLTSVYQNVPIKNLIVIDGFSSDRTLKILDEFNRRYGNVKLFQMEGSRARARTAGIAKVTTEWFVFVDSDVILSRGWFSKIQSDASKGVGAVWGVNIDLLPNVKNRHILKVQMRVARRCFKLRGGMHDTLILHKAVAGIRIPEELHAYEDAYLVRLIERRGYKVLVASEAYCLHDKPPDNWSLKNGLSQSIVELRCCLVYSHLYEYVLFYPVFFLYWALQLPLNGFRNGLHKT